MTTTARQLADRTADAYMADEYATDNAGVTHWHSCCQLLLDQGLSAREAEGWLRSKHMRWANDCTGEATVDGLRRYIADRYDAASLKSAARTIADETGL
jgi:hypothetical protein